VLVNADLAVPEWPGVWVLGDCAQIPDRRQTGTAYPSTAQHALRAGKVVARNIAAVIRGQPTVPFVFSSLGQLAAIGGRTGVAHVLGVNFSGFLAWWLWRTVYLSKLPRFEKKLRVALDWTFDLFFAKDLVQFITSRASTMRQMPWDVLGAGYGRHSE
jgi:NADH:quinone reductase (non-electrogenic)